MAARFLFSIQCLAFALWCMSRVRRFKYDPDALAGRINRRFAAVKMLIEEEDLHSLELEIWQMADEINKQKDTPTPPPTA
jgi:hypothetical protein